MSAAFLALLVATPAEAHSDQATRIRASYEIATALAHTQQRSGHLLDRLDDGRSQYGDAMGGLGMLQTGLRQRNRRLVTAGERSLNYTTRAERLELWNSTTSFKLDAVASAYNLLRASGSRHGPYSRFSLRRWANWLRHQKTTYLNLAVDGYENKYLVDAIAVLETQRTGLRSSMSGAILGTGRADTRDRAVRLLSEKIPRAVQRSHVLSDPGFEPIAYHNLSFAYYARGIQLLGREAPPRCRAVLRRLAEAEQQLAAPDGDVAYWGRSQEQKWTLATAAYGLAFSARMSLGSTAVRRQHHSLANRLTQRLSAYGAGRDAENITPASKQDFRRARKSLDRYARTTDYSGLSLNYLNRTIAIAHDSRVRIPADRSGQRVLSQGSGRFATVTHGNLWYAVRERALGSLRYDVGLVAFKRLSDGGWRDVIPLRPNIGGTAGPALIHRGRSYPFTGGRLSVGRNGVVRLRGRFGNVAGRPVSVTIRPDPSGKCVHTTVERPRAGDDYLFAFYSRGSGNQIVEGHHRIHAQDGQVADFQGGSVRARRAEHGFSSASDAELSRRFVTVHATGKTPVSMVAC